MNIITAQPESLPPQFERMNLWACEVSGLSLYQRMKVFRLYLMVFSHKVLTRRPSNALQRDSREPSCPGECNKSGSCWPVCVERDLLRRHICCITEPASKSQPSRPLRARPRPFVGEVIEQALKWDCKLCLDPPKGTWNYLPYHVY